MARPRPCRGSAGGRPSSWTGHPGHDPSVLDGPLGRVVHRAFVAHSKTFGPVHGGHRSRGDDPASREHASAVASSTDPERGPVFPVLRFRLLRPCAVPPEPDPSAGPRIPTTGTPASLAPGVSAELSAEPPTDLGTFRHNLKRANHLGDYPMVDALAIGSSTSCHEGAETTRPWRLWSSSSTLG